MKPTDRPGHIALAYPHYSSYCLALMTAYLLTSGTIFALMAAMHLFITVEHWRQGSTGTWDVLAPAAFFAISTALG